MPVTIAVADDEEQYRELVRFLLASLSDMIVVGEADNGEEALSIALRELPTL